MPKENSYSQSEIWEKAFPDGFFNPKMLYAFVMGFDAPTIPTVERVQRQKKHLDTLKDPEAWTNNKSTKMAYISTLMR